ncbi:MAG: hypothetical protein CM15mP62_23250 [Rhodospirillaceae bacterium]|nr:MAG: hypothetical protein CM15mP62_23250 [Rhodospirillaceae bacterium]
MGQVLFKRRLIFFDKGGEASYRKDISIIKAAEAMDALLSRSYAGKIILQLIRFENLLKYINPQNLDLTDFIKAGDCFILWPGYWRADNTH